MSRSRLCIAPRFTPVFLALVAMPSAATTLLDAVVVSGSLEATALSETPSAIGKVELESIRNAKPIRNDELVNMVPGVQMVDLGNEQHSMSIRQPITTTSVYQYLEDGIPIRPQGVFNHNALNEINVNSLESVEVLRGPSSSLYGSNAIGGAVNFLSRAPSATPEARIGLLGSTEGYRRLEAGYSDSAGPSGLRLAYHNARLRDSWRQHNAMDKDALTLRGDYAPTDRDLIKVILTYSDLLNDTAGSLNATDFETNPAKSYHTFSTRADTASRLSGSWEKDDGAGTLTTLTFYGRTNSHAQVPNYTISACTAADACPGGVGPTSYKGTSNDNSYSSLGFVFHQRKDLTPDGVRLIYGALLDRSPNQFTDDRTYVTRDAASLVYTGYTIGPRRREYEAIIQGTALYLQAEIPLWTRAQFVGGFRHDRLRYGFDNHLVPGNTTGAPDESRHFSHTSPKLGLVQDLGGGQSVYANYSQGFAPPEVSQQYSTLAVPNLEAAVFNSYDLGWRAPLADGRVELDIAAYLSDGRKEIVSFQIAPGNSEPRNAGKTRHKGLELGAKFKLTGRVSARLATAFAEHRYVEYRASPALNYSGKDMAGAPQNITHAEVAWKPAPSLRVALENEHLSKYFMNDANTVVYPGYTIWNIRASWEQGPWEVWLKLMNATDRLYATSASSSYNGTLVFNPALQTSYTPGDPRTVYLGVAWHFGEAARTAETAAK